MKHQFLYVQCLIVGIALLLVWPTADHSLIAQQPAAEPFERVAGRDAAPRRVLVKFRESVTTAAVQDAEQQADADLSVPLGRDSRVRLLRSRSRSAAALAAMLRTHPEIEYVEPDYVVRAVAIPNDIAFGTQWGLRNIGLIINGRQGTAGADVHAEAAWDIAKGSANVVVGIVDGGFDYTHPDLAANVWAAPRSFTVTIGPFPITCPAGTHGARFQSGSATCDPSPVPAAHATNVAGIAGAVTGNQVGVAGMSWHTSLMSLNFLLDGQTGFVSDAINAVDFAVQVKAFFAGTAAGNIRVLNNSWIGAGYSTSLQNAIDEAAANDILFVGAAGNSSVNLDVSPDYPASFNRPNQLTLAASDNRDQRASFSNFSSTSVHMAAPGQDIYSTLPGSNYGFYSGTSMASPMAAGAAALVLSRCDLNTKDLKSLLMASVDRLDAFAQITASGGRLNVARALQTCASGRPGVPPSVSLSAPLDKTVYSEQSNIRLGATAADTDGSIVRVDFYADSTLIGSTSASPYSTTWSHVASGTYALKAVAVDNDGLQTTSNIVGVNIAPAAGGSQLPAPWQHQDIGATGLAGSASYSGGMFTVRGAGADIGGTSDAFHIVYQPLAADGQIVVRVASLGNTSSDAKAAIVMRGDLSAGSFAATLALRPGGLIEFSSRERNSWAASTIATRTQGVPIWLKLTRLGRVIGGHVSSDGVNWFKMGQAFLDGAPGYAGLGVTSHDASQLNTSTFDNVSIVGGTPPGGRNAPDIVIYAGDLPASALHGSWAIVSDATAADGLKLATPDNGFATTAAPLAAPAHYFDVAFNAEPGVPYAIWLRMKALNDNKFNDSLFVQFSDASVNGSGVFPINSSSGLCVNLATDTNATSLNDWGWQNGCYWLAQATRVTFTSSGTHTIRVQVREDGVQIDQIVLSPSTYLTTAPGLVGGDHVVVPKPSGPAPPGLPASPSPANGATGVGTTTTLRWTAANASTYDVSFGTTTPPPVVLRGQASSSYTVQPLAPGTKYFWEIVAHNDSGGGSTGPIWSFTTASASSPSDIVVYASDIPAGARHGAWTAGGEATSPYGMMLATPNNGVSNVNAPLAAPTDYVDLRFSADAGVPYTLWLRLKALNNDKFNDAVWAQFSDATAGGTQVYPLNSTSGLLINLATDGTASSLNNWGWTNSAYWLNQPTTVSFSTSGVHTLRVQVREDGVQLDQIVLSPGRYRSAAPGPPGGDSTIVAKPAMSGSPFTGTPFNAPGSFEAEDFDLGGEGVAYHDLAPGNAGGVYRPGDVDLLTAPGNGSRYVVNNFQTGEWLAYTINVQSTGTYAIQLKVSSEFATSRGHVEIDGVDVTGSFSVPTTGSWGTFLLVTCRSGLNLGAGTHVLRVYSDQEYFNVDAVQLS